MKSFFKKYKHSLVLSYMLVYFIWFCALENRTISNYHIMYCKVDDYIPFNEYFVIPYVLWFIYIALTVLYFMFYSTDDFYKCTAFLFIGMTICLIIYTFWPNAQTLRVSSFKRNNILTRLVYLFYTNDTPTNVCPSIHVYNSIGAHISIVHCKQLKKKPLIPIISFLLMVSICLSTMFIKQHSFVDFTFGVLLSIVMYIFVYKIDFKKIHHQKAIRHKKDVT